MRKNNKSSVTASILGGLALGVSKFAANSRCAFIYHQPKLPDNIKKYKKS